MKPTTTSVFLSTVLLSTVALMSSPAHANGQHNNGKGHGNGNANGQSNSPKAQGRHDNGRHLGWEKQAWKRGDHLSLIDLEPRYYIDDYRAYNLKAPPTGYRWVRPMDDRYLLIQAATGLIDEVLGY